MQKFQKNLAVLTKWLNVSCTNQILTKKSFDIWQNGTNISGTNKILIKNSFDIIFLQKFKKTSTVLTKMA